MEPYLLDGRVVVPDTKTASTLMNKGSYGEPLPGGLLSLTIMEAAYLKEKGRISVKSSRRGRKIDLNTLISMGIASGENFLENHLVHRDLRNRGLIAKITGSDDFLVYPRGGKPEVKKADTWIKVHRGSDSHAIRDLYVESVARNNAHLRMVIAVVDSDWDITYYEIRPLFREPPASKHEMRPSGEINRVPVPRGGSFVWNGDVNELHEHHFAGIEFLGGLLLSEEEDADIFDGPSIDDEGKDNIKHSVYADLRDRGCMVKTGFKYGTHFRVYTSHPDSDHSDYLVHCMDGRTSLSWEEYSRGIRLCHTVNKTMIYAFRPANPNNSAQISQDPSYLTMCWIRP